MIEILKGVKLKNLRARKKSPPILEVIIIPNHLIIMILNVSIV
jgi:hypothetical protein